MATIKTRLRKTVCVDCPISLVCIAGALPESTRVRKVSFPGGREKIELLWYTPVVAYGMKRGHTTPHSAYISRLCPRLQIRVRNGSEPYVKSVKFDEEAWKTMSRMEYYEDVQRKTALLDDPETFHFE